MCEKERDRQRDTEKCTHTVVCVEREREKTSYVVINALQFTIVPLGSLLHGSTHIHRHSPGSRKLAVEELQSMGCTNKTEQWHYQWKHKCGRGVLQVPAQDKELCVSNDC